MPTSGERDSKIIVSRCEPLQLSWSAGGEGRGGGRWERRSRRWLVMTERNLGREESVGITGVSTEHFGFRSTCHHQHFLVYFCYEIYHARNYKAFRVSPVAWINHISFLIHPSGLHFTSFQFCASLTRSGTKLLWHGETPTPTRFARNLHHKLYCTLLYFTD